MDVMPEDRKPKLRDREGLMIAAAIAGLSAVQAGVGSGDWRQTLVGAGIAALLGALRHRQEIRRYRREHRDLLT